jgi:hypothetical protein
MNNVIPAVLTTTLLFTTAGWSQTICGVEQHGLTNPNGSWNDLSHEIIDYPTGLFRIYWSCGNPDGICVGHETSATSSRDAHRRNACATCCALPPGVEANGNPVMGQQPLNRRQDHLTSSALDIEQHISPHPPTQFDGEPVSVNNFSSVVCDIQDPTVVQFNGAYYLFAGGIPAGSPGCGMSGNEHAGIYSFSSPDGLSWSPLNGSSPVVAVPADPACYLCYSGHGNWSPSAVVMGSGRFIRMYYSQEAPGYGPSGIMSMDTYDGVSFFNQRLILADAWAACVKRVGLSGDYPMVMTYRTGSGDFAATSSWSSDTSWIVGNGGAPIFTSPAARYPPTIDGDLTGLFGGGAYRSPISGQVDFWWPSGSPSRIYRGQASAAQFFNF